MHALEWLGGATGIILLLIAAAAISDRRWYRKHPGENERFCRIDDELNAQGRY